jgi:hypothetical protein
MKKLFYFSFIAVLAFSSCTKSSSSTTGTFKATINGVAVNVAAFAQKNGTALNIDGSPSFSGTTPTYPFYAITIGNYTGVGTYTIGGSALNGLSIDSSASSNSSPVLYGQIVITSATPTLAGTFYGTCYDSTKITNGSFSVTAP